MKQDYTLEDMVELTDHLFHLGKALADALTAMRPMCGAPHDFTVADVWNAQKAADEALTAWKEGEG